MNLIKKIYCRVFQFCFWAALPILPYREPKILNEMSQIGEVLKEKKRNKVLIVTDKGISSLGLLNGLKKSLDENSIEYVIYDDTVPNPTIDNVERARTNMLKAAYCAGIAFSQSYVGYVHGVAHSLGGQYSTPHGLANAVILPYFLEEYGESCHKRLGKLRKKIFQRWQNMQTRKAIRCIRFQNL